MTFVFGASQVQPLETDGFPERSPKIQLNASRRPLLEELVMVLHCAARKLSAQLWLQPKPQHTPRQRVAGDQFHPAGSASGRGWTCDCVGSRFD